MSVDLNAFPEYPDCCLCKDTGLLFGDDRPFEFCKCARGRKRQEEEPHVLDQANEVRAKIGLAGGVR